MLRDLKGPVVDVQGLQCKLPPVGKVYNILSGKVEHRGVYSRSPKKSEQFWEKQSLPPDWEKLRHKEIARQEVDPDYYDPNLETIRMREWDRRLNGFWFNNNGEATYITGLHYFYLNYWMIDTGLPKYRETDKRFFYFLQYCMDDPECLGMIEITKRRQGKTFRGGVFLYEYTSRNKNARSGIQSKTGADAREVFRKAIIQPFKKLPDFFVPVYDQSKGLTPTSELRFFQTTVKGKKSNDIKGGEELESMIDWKPSEAISYDGQKLHRLLTDEAGKTAEVDVWHRHLVTKYCLLDDEGKIIGKNLVTSTVEEMESGGKFFKKMWEASDHTSKEGGRTASGLYRYFCSAADTRYYDVYGHPDRERALIEIGYERKLLEKDSRALSSVIRKEPITPEEAFRVDGDSCIYDAMLLNERMDKLSWTENITEKGEFVWQDGVRDSKVLWKPSKNGHWEVCWLPKDEIETNKIAKRGDTFSPNNMANFVMAVDPFDHKITEDGKMSNGAGIVLRKRTPLNEGDAYSRAFVAKYCHRPDLPSVYYEEMLKAAVYFGCEILYENNKAGIMDYFEQRGYGNFMMWLPDRLKPGIAASDVSKQFGAELTDAYIRQDYDKIFFKDLISDWLDFKIDKSTKYDLAMAAMWCLVAEAAKVSRKDTTEVRDVTEYFRANKIR